MGHRFPERAGDSVTIRNTTNGADGTSTLRRMRIVDVVQNLGEFAGMTNDPQPGKAMAIFSQRPVDAFQGAEADKVFAVCTTRLSGNCRKLRANR